MPIYYEAVRKPNPNFWPFELWRKIPPVLVFLCFFCFRANLRARSHGMDIDQERQLCLCCMVTAKSLRISLRQNANRRHDNILWMVSCFFCIHVLKYCSSWSCGGRGLTYSHSSLESPMWMPPPTEKKLAQYLLTFYVSSYSADNIDPSTFRV